MKVLHVASFNGNIGDHANHNGFRNSMERYVSSQIQYTNLEIREFYKSWGIRKFDSCFIDYANTHDLLVFGGGNFFELCWDYSVTGTTIDMTFDVLNQIKSPIIFNGMGIDDKNGLVNPSNIKKFDLFLKEITSSSKCLLTVRNDGSKDIAEKYYDSTVTKRIFKVPDGGFFTIPKEYDHPELPEGYKLIAINVAGDAANIRFSADETSDRISEQQFIIEMSLYMNKILEMNDNIFFIFTPHIVKDYSIIAKLMDNIKDIYVRRRIAVAPCLNGNITDGDYIIDIYKKCNLTIGMRYHSNVCSIGVNTPSIGIVNFTKHKLLFHDIGMYDRVVESDMPNFSERLLSKSMEFLKEEQSKKEENQLLLKRLNKENKDYFGKIKELLIQNKVL